MMRTPRFRFTIRRLMLLVGITGVDAAVVRWSVHHSGDWHAVAELIVIVGLPMANVVTIVKMAGIHGRIDGRFATGFVVSGVLAAAANIAWPLVSPDMYIAVCTPIFRPVFFILEKWHAPERSMLWSVIAYPAFMTVFFIPQLLIASLFGWVLRRLSSQVNHQRSAAPITRVEPPERNQYPITY